jgi:altronate dehydratase small subunit
MTLRARAIVIHNSDNVATALERNAAGTVISIDVCGRADKVRLLSEIPMGHKFALKDIEAGEAVIKYGEVFGKSTTKITRGEHVHVHNVVSQGRGELR